MADEVIVTEGAMVEKYSQEQLDHSRALLGRDPEGHELRAHHPDGPAHGVTYGTGGEPIHQPTAVQEAASDESEGDA